MTRYIDIQPHPDAIKTIYGWENKHTGELLVAAYGVFKDELEQQEQGETEKTPKRRNRKVNKAHEDESQ